MLGGEISDGDEEDGDESSSSALGMMPNQFTSALEEFREQWQKELNAQNQNSSNNLTEKNQMKSNNTELALALFVRGVELEKLGKVYDALEFYRKAIQIVPDIEFIWYESTKKTTQTQLTGSLTNNKKSAADCSAQETSLNPNSTNTDEDLSDVNLYARFQNELNNDYLIKNAIVDGVISTSKHISDLPTEILFYILRWVVSSQVDARSLEQCSAVCKGLYLCARDDEIWRLICLKVWGISTGQLSNTPYKCWRQMFIERDRILFGGCYISKTTYLRYGENSFQDQFYRPVQLIEYYRYLRFLPDGTVVMWTTPEEPAQAVTKLKHISMLRPEVLSGHYRLHGQVVTIILKRSQKFTLSSSASAAKRKVTANNTELDNNGFYTYYIEFKINSTAKRRFVQLHWNNYSIIQIKNKREVTSDFELTASKYPPLWFSKVKSYHAEAEYPLQ